MEILCSLLNDLGEWVRSNISYGFINLGYILCGFDSLVSQMGDVVNFWKPYRARLIPLEMLEFRSRLTESIIVEDNLDTIDVEPTFHDFLTGDSAPCCGQDATSCFDATTAPQFYSREYYDCGSYHDLGAVTDMPKELFVEVTDTIHDGLNCVPADLDSTAIIATGFSKIVTSYVISDSTTVQSMRT